MSESDFFEWLNNEAYQKVLRSIEKIPKKASEIAEQSGLPLDTVKEIIECLEKNKAIICVGVKYKATDVMEVFKKYLRLFKEYFG